MYLDTAKRDRFLAGTNLNHLLVDGPGLQVTDLSRFAKDGWIRRFAMLTHDEGGTAFVQARQDAGCAEIAVRHPQLAGLGRR